MLVQVLEVLCPQDPGDNHSPLCDQCLAIGAIEGGDLPPYRLVLSGWVLSPEPPQVSPLVQHLQHCHIVIISIGSVNQVNEFLIEGLALVDKGYRAVKPREEVRDRLGLRFMGKPICNKVMFLWQILNL